MLLLSILPLRLCAPPTHSALPLPTGRTFLSTSPAISERTELPNGTACCDTSVTVFWDDSIGKYAVFDRIEPLKPPFRGSRGRRIGRCVRIAASLSQQSRLRFPKVQSESLVGRRATRCQTGARMA